MRMPMMARGTLALAVALVAAGCEASVANDAGAMGGPIATCEDAVALALGCTGDCMTERACTLTTTCALPNCPVRRAECRNGRLFVDVSLIPCDTGPPSLDAGFVAHTCADARNVFAGRDCGNGCDAGGAACDFTDDCCLAPSVLVGCVGGHIVTEEFGRDVGGCDWDASVDAAAP